MRVYEFYAKSRWKCKKWWKPEVDEKKIWSGIRIGWKIEVDGKQKQVESKSGWKVEMGGNKKWVETRNGWKLEMGVKVKSIGWNRVETRNGCEGKVYWVE